ncbi:hypothetical protein Q8F55_004040 [Vanrija albida]|uniref:sulfiredoxin n=1 Tax=Vanrija albida TaxID=181172 RepID=A0ABR3Q5T5_9TREE
MTSCIPDDLRQHAKPARAAADISAAADAPPPLGTGPRSVEAPPVTEAIRSPAPTDAEGSTATKTAGSDGDIVGEGVTHGGAIADTSASDESGAAAHAKSSIFARDETAPIHVVPMRVIHRPLPSELDEQKVQSFMQEMQAGDVFTPIEVIKVRAPLKTDPSGTVQNFYFSMGGCHRYEATKRLGLPNIRARIIEVPPAAMRMYLGVGSPF